ncbi:MAG: hypothetical protein ACRERE_17430 [Candidatus Entotheonellia bacterium]
MIRPSMGAWGVWSRIGRVAGPVLWDGAGARVRRELGLCLDPLADDFGRLKRLSGPVQPTFAVQYQVETPLTLWRIWMS